MRYGSGLLLVLGLLATTHAQLPPLPGTPEARQQYQHSLEQAERFQVEALRRHEEQRRWLEHQQILDELRRRQERYEE